MSKNSEFRRLIPPGAAELSASFVKTSSRGARLLLQTMESRWFRWLALAIERLTVPGIQLHYLARKCFVDEAVRAALRDGFSQVVIIGAGFDTLALRLAPAFPTVRFIEVDHPATQRYKRRTLEMQQPVYANMGFLAVDLTRQSIQERLTTSPLYRSDNDTIFIAEGVLMYLTADEVTAIFRLMGAGGDARRRVVFTFIEPDSSGRTAFHHASHAVDFWLRLRGEPFRWGIHRDTLPAFLESVGYALNGIATAQTFRACYGIHDTPLAEGECICVAERR